MAVLRRAGDEDVRRTALDVGGARRQRCRKDDDRTRAEVDAASAADMSGVASAIIAIKAIAQARVPAQVLFNCIPPPQRYPNVARP